MGSARGFGVDVGGSGIKGSPVDIDGGVLADERLRIPTPEPSTPDAVADAAVEIVEKFGWTGPVGVTLPCVVKQGTAHTAANVDDSWIGRPLSRVEELTGTRVAYVTRLGEGVLPTPRTVHQEGDLLHLVIERPRLDEVERILDSPPPTED